MVASALLLGGCQAGDDKTDFDTAEQDEKKGSAGSKSEGKSSGGDDRHLMVSEADEAHHGVAVRLSGGKTLLTVGTEDERTGAKVVDKGGKEIARSEDCPGVHGEAAGKDEDSRYILGDYKVDKDAELERPEKVSVTDTKDGTLKVIDPKTAEVTEEYPVIDEWEEPIEWQKARPTLFVQDEVAYVSEPDSKEIHIVDLDDGEVMSSATLPQATNSPASPAYGPVASLTDRPTGGPVHGPAASVPADKMLNNSPGR